MFTRCPECLTTQAVTPEALRSGRGMVRCSRCAVMFDALATLAETETQAVADAPPDDEPWAEKKTRSPRVWRFGFFTGLFLLIVQGVYFEGVRALQNPKLRTALENLCGALHCRLPDYRNLAELSVLHNSFDELPNRHYAFKLVLNNESSFSMRYPAIGLTLLSYGGQPFAYRLFQPGEYLAGQPENAQLAANGAAEISLEIAPTQTKVGGFHFDLSD
ncbi:MULTISPECIES: zinc-ribbon and DUF3426 domain-containing protein [Methylomicrobium]|uniref:Zinc finger/thioredoxin putative domain-containing protein n=1 Tax=Methylomicrobium album BG8 TaxID=686340 RepID=H8GJW8_METAL|nr:MULTISPECIES: zinc-ribbon and DUF3426 domain-containing protein [Methylomicrobium]EIC27927.1 Protein of unknown function (DUF3426) [Methylomicrobium album BG8]